MIKVENIDVFNFEGALRGMRNPLQSHSKSDSAYGCDVETSCANCGFNPNWCGNATHYVIGKNDLELMQKLYKAGTEHRKYLRQIFVSMDIVAPDYWFKEFSTYRIGVTENSTSTMHCIAKKKFELDDFSHEHLYDVQRQKLRDLIEELNFSRGCYLKTKSKNDWWQMIQLLPMSYNYRRTVTMNYENVVTIIKQRTGHRLTEWGDFCAELSKLPYVEEIMQE